MNPPEKLNMVRRWIIILVLALILVIFLAGTLRAFSPANAANSTAGTLTPPATYTPPVADEDSYPAPTPTPVLTPVEKSADLTGVIALVIVVVVVTLVGMVWGEGSFHRKKKNRK